MSLSSLTSNRRPDITATLAPSLARPQAAVERTTWREHLIAFIITPWRIVVVGIAVVGAVIVALLAIAVVGLRGASGQQTGLSP
jgi:hypothetical protein